MNDSPSTPLDNVAPSLHSVTPNQCFKIIPRGGGNFKDRPKSVPAIFIGIVEVEGVIKCDILMNKPIELHGFIVLYYEQIQPFCPIA